MMDDILLNKASTIEKCIKRIKEEYVGHENEISTNFTKQDSIILNIQRACEAAIDMGTRTIKLKRLGIPQSIREVFVLLEDVKIIPSSLSKKLQAMIGFRNIAVHDYSRLNLDIVKSIVEKEIDDFKKYCEIILKLNLS